MTKQAITMIIIALTVMGGMTYAQPHVRAGQNMTSAPSITMGKWTASDQPYKLIEAQIKKEYAQGSTLSALGQKYKIYAQQHPADPVAQLAWVYAARGAAALDGTLITVGSVLLQALAKSDPGNVHEYTRYRFCITENANRVLPASEIKTIGDKLLRYDPHDQWVRLNLINMLCDTSQQNAALPYALTWIKQEPNNPKAHSALALVYEDQWVVSNRRADAAKSIAEYQQYLRLAPPTDAFYSFAQRLVKNIGEMSAKQQ